MAKKIRRVTLSEDVAAKTAERLRADPQLQEYLTDEKIEDLAAQIAEEEIATVTIDAETGEVLTEDGEHTGKTLEELAGERVFGAVVLHGDQDQLSLDVGAREAVRTGSLKVKQFERTIKGQFPIGARLRLEVEIEVTGVALGRVYDNNGVITGIHRLHAGEVEGVERADE